MNKIEALKALCETFEVRLEDWAPDRYLSLCQETGNILDDMGNSKTVTWNAYKFDGWEFYNGNSTGANNAPE